MSKVDFIVYPEKCIFTPVQLIEYLDFIIDSQKILVSLKDDEKSKQRSSTIPS